MINDADVAVTLPQLKPVASIWLQLSTMIGSARVMAKAAARARRTCIAPGRCVLMRLMSKVPHITVD